MVVDEKRKKLKMIADQIARCQRCPLFNQATKSVPGEGSPGAKILFLGEAPGFNEDQRGIPFCGAAGRLLDQLLLSIEINRQDVFITNVLKHRPPNNRDPLPGEIAACKGFLDEQIKTINPKIIVTLGRFSMRKFLPEEYISRAHGQARYVNFVGRKRIIMPMYHPAAALRNGTIMNQLKEDFLKIKMFLGDELNLEEEALETNEEEQLALI